MDTFIVSKWEGTIVLSREAEKIMWLTSDISNDIKVGSIFEHKVTPRLKKLDLID